MSYYILKKKVESTKKRKNKNIIYIRLVRIINGTITAAKNNKIPSTACDLLWSKIPVPIKYTPAKARSVGIISE